MADKQFIYVTGHNATGKTTLGLNIVKDEAVAGQGWFCIDGDDFVREHPDLNDEHINISQTNIMTLMRGGLNLDGLTEADRYEKVKEHDDEVLATWKPFFRKVFERLLEVMAEKDMKKVIFPFHCWRDWTVDLIRECFGKDYKLKIVEVTVDPQLRYKRWVERQVGKGMDVDKRWREDAGEQMTKLRDLYGPEYKGNEEHFLKFVEQRYFFPRQPMPEGDKDVFVIKNDKFEGGVEFQKMLNSGIQP